MSWNVARARIFSLICEHLTIFIAYLLGIRKKWSIPHVFKSTSEQHCPPRPKLKEKRERKGGRYTEIQRQIAIPRSQHTWAHFSNSHLQRKTSTGFLSFNPLHYPVVVICRFWRLSITSSQHVHPNFPLENDLSWRRPAGPHPPSMKV